MTSRPMTSAGPAAQPIRNPARILGEVPACSTTSGASDHRLGGGLAILEPELTVGHVLQDQEVVAAGGASQLPACARRSSTGRSGSGSRGPLRGDLEYLVHGLGIEGRVRFLGVRYDVPDLLRAVDVFALTSVSEAASLTLLEAMASRLPVVVTAVGGNPEIVRDGVEGLLVRGDADAAAAAFLRLLDDPAAAARMGERAAPGSKSGISCPERSTLTGSLPARWPDGAGKSNG